MAKATKDTVDKDYVRALQQSHMLQEGSEFLQVMIESAGDSTAKFRYRATHSKYAGSFIK